MMNWNLAPNHSSPVVVNVNDQDSLLADLEQHFEQGRGFAIATLNLDHVVKLRKDAAFHQAYSAHTHITADGNPVVWLSHLAGQNDITLIPGSELIEPVSSLAAQHQIPVALFGATDESLQQAATALQSQIQGLNIVLCLSPPMGFDPDGATASEAIETIRASGARMVFLALGAPKQERFAQAALKALPEVGFLSIGAGLDFISGNQTRAPRWVRAVALEWLWRMIGNPRRLAMRYAGCIAILPRLALHAWRNRSS